MLKYSKDINKIYDDCLTHFSKLAILKKVIKKTQKNCGVSFSAIVLVSVTTADIPTAQLN